MAGDVKRACAVCGRPIHHGPSHKRYCSARCRKAANNARQRGHDPIVPVLKFLCAECKKVCRPGINAPRKATRFCSERCKVRWHSLPVPSESEQEAAQEARVRYWERENPDLRPKYRGAACDECGTLFATLQPCRRYCSKACRVRVRCRSRRSADPRKIYLQSVGDLAGWKCGICDGDVDPLLRVPDPMAPTVDHIVPLVAGGAHSMENVQLAHFLCNSQKRDLPLSLARACRVHAGRPGGEQVRYRPLP